MNQRTTGLVVGLVSFVILTVALTATTIYFFVGMQKEAEKAKNASDAQRLAQEKDRKTEEAYGQLMGFVLGDPNARPDGIDRIKEALGSTAAANVKAELADLRSKVDQLSADKAGMEKLVADAQADAKQAREQAKQASTSAQTASKGVGDTLNEYKSKTDEYGTKVETTVTEVRQAQADADARVRTAEEKHQREIDEASSRNAELSTRIAELEKNADQYRMKPANAAALADGRVIDVGGAEGEIYLSIGSKQRVQPGMTFEVYDSPNAIKFDPATNDLAPGKARVVILKTSENTSTAKVVPDSASGSRSASGKRIQKPIVRDDVIANAMYSPDYRYKFMVHGKFDFDGDGVATAAEADYIRGRIKAWGGEVVEGEKLRGDVDFIVMGKQPPQPPEPPADADTDTYTAYRESRKAYDAYRALFDEAKTARVPVLNWNRMQVLTNEGR